MNIYEILTDYDEIYDRPIPIKYDVLKLSDEHRKFDGLIRRYWDNLHPLVRDLFTSFANEFQYLINLAAEVEKTKDEEINELRNLLVSKMKNMNENLENINIEHNSEISIKDDQLQAINTEKNSLLEKINHLIENLENKQVIIKEKDILIIHQKNEISKLNHDLKQNVNKNSQTSEVIANSIAVVEQFTSQLDLLEKELLMTQNEKQSAEDRITLLEKRIEVQEHEFKDILQEKDERLIFFKDSLKKIYVATEKGKAENKAAMKRNESQIIKISELEYQLQDLQNEYGKIKKYLDNQIKINKSYHALTLKVIEIGESEKLIKNDTSISQVKQVIHPKRPKVPDLLSQIQIKSENKVEKSHEVILPHETVLQKFESKEVKLQKTEIDKRVKEDENSIIIKNKILDLVTKKKENPIIKDLKKILNAKPPVLPVNNTDNHMNEKDIINRMLSKLNKEEPYLKQILSDFPKTPTNKFSEDKDDRNMISG